MGKRMCFNDNSAIYKKKRNEYVWCILGCIAYKMEVIMIPRLDE